MLTFVLACSAWGQDRASEARAIVDQILKEDYAALSPRFSAEVKAGLPEDKFRAAVQGLKSLGAVLEILPPELQQAQGFEVAVVGVKFEKAAINVQIAFNQAGEIAGLFFRPRQAPAATAYKPPPYSRPDSFRNEEVTAGAPDWPLPATLSLPVSKQSVPAVVLVHGSGPHDRDETIGPNKPFRDLAEGLASRGIAVLRYEKRTKLHGAKMAPVKTLTVKDETVDDALAAVALLRKRAEIDPARIFVLGHSLGGYLAPRMGREDGKLAGLILLAANVRPVEDLVIEQTTYLAELAGGQAEAQRKQLEALRQAAQEVKAALSKGGEIPEGQMLLGAPASYWLDLKGYNPAELAAGLPQRLLVLHGERDYQVTMTDFALWQKSLAKHEKATLRSFPALNHLFMSGEGQGSPAEYTKPGHVAAEVIEFIAKWVQNK